MTSVTMATHQTPKIVAGVVAIYGLVDEPWVQDLIGYIASQLPYLVSKDVSGYAFFSYNAIVPGNNGTGSLSGLIGEFMVCYFELSPTEANSRLPCSHSPPLISLTSIVYRRL